jgi:hypothetical protein
MLTSGKGTHCPPLNAAMRLNYFIDVCTIIFLFFGANDKKFFLIYFYSNMHIKSLVKKKFTHAHAQIMHLNTKYIHMFNRRMEIMENINVFYHNRVKHMFSLILNFLNR